MRKLLSLLLVFSLFMSVLSMNVYAREDASVSETASRGTSVAPDILLYERYPDSAEYQISTAEGLMKFSELGQSINFAGKTLRMICDIEMNGFSYTPPVNFSGVFDGDFHAIKRLTVTTSDANCGFVGKLTSTGVLRNLGMEGCTLTATCSKDGWRAGSLVGIIDKGLVENCWSTSDVSISGGYDYLSVGGIAGGIYNGGIIRNCYFGGTATGLKVAAGICGWGQGHYEGSVGQIFNCFNMGQLVASETKFAIGRYSGSILAENKPKAMFNNYYFNSSYAGYDWSTGATLVSRAQLGSGYLAYRLDKNSPLGGEPVWSQGALFPELRPTAGVYPLSLTIVAKGKSSTATLYLNAGDVYTVGVPDNIAVSLSANAGAVNGRSFVMPASAASLTVTVDAANIANYSTFPNESVYVITNPAGFSTLATAVNGGTTFSGKTFYMLCNIDMNNASHTPIGQFVSNSSWTKSFSGNFYGNNFKVLNLKVNNTSLNGGGLFGSCYKAYFNNLHIFNGSVTVANRAGGIAGYADACTFEYCTNGAAINSTTGKDGIGGIAGVARISSVFNYCGNFGVITAKVTAAAGIAGWGQDNIKMTGCYNAGKVTATDDVAAFARVKAGYTPEFKDCYYMKSACSTTVAGKAYTERDFRAGLIGSYINTAYRTTTSNGVFTNTPAIPAVRNQNQKPAVCTRLYSYANGTNLGYQTICANLGDDIPYTSALNYYSEAPFSAPDAVTSSAYPAGVPFLLSYVTNGGIWSGTYPTDYTRAAGVGLPDETCISKDGYVFAGWFEQSNFAGQPLAVIPPETTGNRTLYAKWATVVNIASVEEYIAFANAVNSGNSYSDTYLTLSSDLDFNGQTIPSVGTQAAPFSGVFDGCGYSMKNFVITGDDAQGIIGYLKHGTVKFLRVENATVSGKTNTGSVVGMNDGGLVLGCMSSADVKSTWTSYEYSVMSQNVRHGTDASPNSTQERIPRMKTHLKKYAPDIIGFQEVDATWKPVIESVLTNYDKQFIYGNTSAQNEGSPLYWNKDKFQALEKGTFWLSETPDVMSYGWGATNHRTCNYAVLKVKSNDMIVIAANTHLDHKVQEARVNGMKLIMKRMHDLEAKYEAKGYKEIYFHITGDFNVTPTNAVITDLSTQLTEARYAAVSLGTPVNQNTFSAYDATPSRLIDYMFVSNNTDVTSYKVILDKVNGNAISDHYALYGTIRIGGNSHGGIAGENNGMIVSCAYTGAISSAGGSSGIAAENNGRILSSYSQYTATATGVFANAITTKYNVGQVHHSYYQKNAGLSGAGTTVSDMKARDMPDKLNTLLHLWGRDDALYQGLPFICKAHKYEYKSNGETSHTATCINCKACFTQEHAIVITDAIAPTCTTNGLTEGKHCAQCGEVLLAQESIPAVGHTAVRVEALAPTCTTDGLTEGTYCSVCNKILTAQEIIPATGHTPKLIPGTPATCTASGTSDGEKCSVCGLVTVEQTTVPRLGHSYKYIDNGDGTHHGDCIRCKKTTTAAAHTYENGICTACGEGGTSEPIYDEAVKFSHSLTLENDISINFIGLGSALIGYDSFYLECKVPVYNGNELVGYETVTIEPVYNGKNYECTLLGITAKMMNDEIEAVFHMTKDGQEYYSKTDVYSVAEYAYGKLDSTKAGDTAELKTVCANLLRYGSMAQIQFNYRTDALVDTAMTDAHKAFLTDLNTVEMMDYRKQLSDLDTVIVPWKSTTLELGNKVIMCLIANLANYSGDPSELTMRLSYTDAKDVAVTEERPLSLYNPEALTYAVSYDCLRATEMRTIVSAAIYRYGERVSKTVEYSIESYGARSKDPAMQELCRAMLAYGDSANAFFAN